ncbi:dihydrolipoyllysine-residue acetyltransferase [Ottowia sp.]|uniref:dihydrolipoyllysine-residue acetyltransferase n=1 Tax=Ottowia sp. TaxID=1898956 RepID=UPI002CF33455|nr:dihydrolipoyllysine-residue acetyltransferase [Ottowia sp.]HOB66880.1 dihydrolipoyllysine-residue acetyltransferase [Ottowia sp.]HPZ57773.1 dihydrolipoyllysine-residue acetyltransferase [Ottowia sp.]HQD46641.1 dihydrolipoyllysine-residue acetyltransferase [Ottowia sp.]
MALVEVKVPDIGDFKDVGVIEVLVKPGDTVKAEQSLITVESDKASMEIPSSMAGVVKELKVKVGDTVNEGSVVLLLEAEGAAAAVNPVNAEPPVGGSEVVPGASQAAAVARAADTAGAGAAAAPAAGGAVEVRVPDIGDFKDVAVIEVFVKPGDTVKVEQSLITVESDKASMEIPSSHAGVVKEMKVKVGDKINQGDLLAIVEGAGAAPAAAPAPAAPAASESKQAPAPAQPAQAAIKSEANGAAAPAPHDPTKPPVGLPYASPSVRKFARELGVPLDEVHGTGPKGRITQDDIQNFTKAVMAGAARTKAQGAAPAAGGGAVTGGGELNLIPWPKVDFAKFGPIERKEMSRIKKISGANLLRNAIMIPAVTNHDDADITDLEAFRVSTNKENEKSGVKVTMLAFLIKACVAALKKFPEFNSSLDGDALIYKQFWHIGFAADTPNGLVVPVIKDADKKGVLQISEEMGALAKKARDGKLGPADMSGATFTISSLGGIGGRYFTPIINAPEVAILGVCRSNIEPVWDGKAFQPRLMLPLSLTWDHRVIDGAAAARFNAYLAQILGDFRRVLL